MMDYDKIYERVVRRGDEILDRRRKRAVKIKHTSYAVSGICAAVIAGTGIWRMTELRELPDERLSEVYISEEDTTDTSSVTSAKTTETSANTSAVRTTVTASSVSESKATETSSAAQNTAVSDTKGVKITETSVHTETKAISQTVPTTAISTVSATTNPVTSAVSSTLRSTATTTKHTTSVTETPMPVTTTKAESAQENFTSTSVIKATTIKHVDIVDDPITTTAAESVSDPQTTTLSEEQMAEIQENTNAMKYINVFSNIEFGGNKYSILDYKISTDDAEKKIGEIELKGSKEHIGYIETTAEIFKVNGYSPDVMIAVKFKDVDRYCRYCNKNYEPDTLGKLISDLSLTADDLGNEAVYTSFKLKNIDREKAWSMMTEDVSAANIYSYCRENNIKLSDNFRFHIRSEENGRRSGFIAVDPYGYILINFNNLKPSCFFIGEDNAWAIIEYFTETYW